MISKVFTRIITSLTGLLLLHIACGPATPPPASNADVPFTQVTIDAEPPSRPWYKMLGDVDGDGQLDIIVAGSKGPMVGYVYPDWAKATIADGGWDGVNGELGDIDGDGDDDIVMGGVVWFVNPGGPRDRWAMNGIDTIRAHDIELADFNMDGRLDVAARDQSAFGKMGDALYVYLQRDMNTWEKQTIPCPHGEGLKAADIDADGDADLIIGGRWYENSRHPNHWPMHVYTSAWTEPDAVVETADINNDGRLDIVLTPAELKGERHQAAWYAAPDNRMQSDWTENIIVPDIECVIHALHVADFNMDGHIDIAMAEMHQGEDPDEVTVHLNLGNGASWRKQLLSNNGSHDIVVGDIGGDGDLDIIGANHAGDAHPLELWENLIVR
jgi:hypothetical protein